MRLGATLFAIIVFSAGSALPALAQRFPFERSFDVTGPSSLDVATIRGKIEITAGDPGRIVVVGTATVRVGSVPANAEDLARKVAENPPIQREGQTLRLGSPSDGATLRAVTVSYQVRVPPETDVTTVSESGATSVRGVSRAVVIRTQSGAIDVMHLGGSAVVTTGSGALTVDGVAGAFTATTSSSSITARSIAGNLHVRTGSGAVNIALSGDGDADVETHSSVIRLSGIRGAVIAATQSGHITLQGEPRRNWTVSAGSGSVDIVAASGVPFTLDASSGGSVKLIGLTVQGSVSKRKVAGAVSGGGPLMKVAIRSGSIVIRAQG